MFFKVDFAKAYDSVSWDYLLEVLEAFGFGQIWCNWIRGTLNSAKVSILINGSPSKEFYCYRGFKQGDPLAPYLFILIMESLHLSFSRVVDEGMFKGIQLPGSISISHLFYADDAMFIGEWSHENLKGVMMGECSSNLKAWDDVILKLRSRLSKWKMKTLSIGGRLTLLKSVLGASPIYYMSIFKVPLGVLKVMESIRSRFFNGMDQSDKKVTLAAWNKVWRFVSQDGSLWYQVIHAIYGPSVGTHSTHLSSNWCSILREVHKLKGKDFDFWFHCKKRIGNGNDTRFWFDCWIGDIPLRDKFPRLFALELEKEASVAVKLNAPTEISFRRNARGGLEQHLMADMNSMLDSVVLLNSSDRWVCDLASDGNFWVKEVRNFIDDLFLPRQAVPTRWVKYIPIKVNIFAWRARQDSLLTRVNLEWQAWLLSIRFSSKVKTMLEGVFFVAWWYIWSFRNRSIFEDSPPRRLEIFDDIVFCAFNWCNSRCHMTFSCVDTQIPQALNKRANLLSKLASLKFNHLNKEVWVEEIAKKSIEEGHEDLWQGVWDQLKQQRFYKKCTEDIRTGAIIGRGTKRQGLCYVDEVTRSGTHSGQGERECIDTLSWFKYVTYEEGRNHSTQPEDPNVSVAQEAPNPIPEVSNTHSYPIFEPVETTNNTSRKGESVQEQVIFSTQEDTPVEQMNVWKSGTGYCSNRQKNKQNEQNRAQDWKEREKTKAKGIGQEIKVIEDPPQDVVLVTILADYAMRGGKKKKSNTDGPLKSVVGFGFPLLVDDTGIIHILEGGSSSMGQVPDVNVVNVSNDPSNTGPALSTSIPGSYANVTGKPSRKSVNFRTLFTPTSNGVDVVVPVESIRAISEWFANTVYDFFLGKRVAYPIC
uniref:RNA-directed DNA polymerase, eukaryota, reverse transcriptase zinc-binding domain protein n=1 Tax=Tanacetum cinerariifolium TaxID=118510 RepID=A0A6L2KYT2_TANCI|nr:RNA-directed DNA polymerase, eukaryota, reverse transcriptase zinc-binding domain protein [Tanacetum cinerariifolium]